MKAQSINHSWTKICGNRMLINYTLPLLLQKVNDQKRMHMIKIWWDHLRNQTLRWPWWTAVFSPIVMATLSMHLQEWDTSADIKLRRRVRSLGKFPDKPHVLRQYQEDYLLESVMQWSGAEEVQGPRDENLALDYLI